MKPRLDHDKTSQGVVSSFGNENSCHKPLNTEWTQQRLGNVEDVVSFTITSDCN